MPFQEKQEESNPLYFAIMIAIVNCLQYKLYMKYIGTILISGLLFSATTLPAQPKEQVMTLDEMYALADANSKTIKIFETALAGAEQDVSVARNAYLPNVDVSASASYNGNVWVADRDFSNGQNFTAPHFGNEFSVEAS